MADVGKISPTKITTYMGCSMAYFLKYIAHEKVPTAIRMLFGKEIHTMLDQFYKLNFQDFEKFSNSFCFRFRSSVAGDFLKGKAKKELEVREIPYTRKNPETRELEKCVLRIGNHVNFGHSTSDEDIKKVFFGYRNLGASICKRFYIKHKPLKPPFKREWSFGVKKDEPIEINGIPVRGVIDRIDEKNGDWYITDYKTDKSSPEKNSFLLHRNIQFTVYSYVFRKIFKIKEKVMINYHLRKLQTFETHRSEKDYDYMKFLIDKVVDGITKDVFVPFYGFHCNWCDFMSSCEKYCMDYHGGPRIDLEGKIKGAKEFKDWDVELPEWMDIQKEER